MKSSTLSLLCLSFLVLNVPADEADETKRPNILFVMSDDHTAQAFGIYGSRLAALDPTPVLDSIAEEGMIFDRAYCTNSICTPSRACIMTGQYSQANGVLDLNGSLPKEKQYLAHVMRDLGYETAMIGKWHLKMEPDFDFYKVLPGQGKYHNPEFRVQGEKPWPQSKQKCPGKHSSDAITDLTLEWLNNRNDDKPFFLMHHFKAPHDMFDNARRYDAYLADTEIPEPSNLHDQPAEGHGSIATRGENDELVRYIGSSVSRRNLGRNMGRHMHVDKDLDDRAYTKEAYQRYLKRYLRCVKGVDDNMKRIVDHLKKTGQYDNTVIIYTGDQGFMLGEHDYIDKRWMYEESMRMPFFVRHPGSVKGGRRTDLLINNTDFAPTIIELAGGKIPDYMQGRSFAKTLKGEDQGEWRTATYYRYWMHMAHGHANPAHFGIRTERWKLIFFYGVSVNPEKGTEYVKPTGKKLTGPTPAAWELYDLQNDPSEMHNLYGDPALVDVIKSLKERLRKTREELDETDRNHPHIQKIIDEHWND